ncbi:hypothetical protein EAG_01550 [Camponotus floridanus]|uniref:Uncharacterized protein n=1 Tax=Camponotus floridanus TaxID=104421 RepID=E2AVT8_CAMFO|nr:hypothetical protein EAG_01550 [Camponotus floridanus]
MINCIARNEYLFSRNVISHIPPRVSSSGRYDIALILELNLLDIAREKRFEETRNAFRRRQGANPLYALSELDRLESTLFVVPGHIKAFVYEAKSTGRCYAGGRAEAIRDDGHHRDIPHGPSSPVTTLHRRCISCFRGVIVRCIYAPLKLISANNETGREVTKGARSRHRSSVGGRTTSDTFSTATAAVVTSREIAAILVRTLHTAANYTIYTTEPGITVHNDAKVMVLRADGGVAPVSSDSHVGLLSGPPRRYLQLPQNSP